MKQKKKFDCVQMMRDIKKEVNAEMAPLSKTQRLQYLRTARKEYSDLVNK
ncbi:MAG: hypothetical protein LBI89_04215 [Prevotellaceae bacterium]|nr:hypothetical protein [Prevotellaceae bacterium]